MVEKYLDELDMKLYYEDSYIEEFDAGVLSCEKENETYKVVLDCTAFFPEGGGQCADTGMLGDSVKVLDVQEMDGIIYHITDRPVEAGETVTGRINFADRYDRMQQHTAEHIVSGIVHAMFGYDNVGFHLGCDVVTMDFNGEMTEEDIRAVEYRANEAVTDNVVVETRFPDREELEQMDYRSKIEINGPVRIVLIPGYDVCACCAPHVQTTGEVGIIKLINAEKYKGGMRITMVCGFRALRDYNSKEKSVKEISVLLSAKPDQTADAVKKLMEQLNEEKAKNARLMASYIQEKVKRVKAEEKLAFLCEDGLGANAMRNFVNGAMEITDGVCCAFSGTDESGYNYVIGSKMVNVAELSRAMNAAFSGKGGGKDRMVQGTVHGKIDEIKNFLMEQ